MPAPAAPGRGARSVAGHVARAEVVAAVRVDVCNQTISGETTWTADNTYVLLENCRVTVADGGTLRIEPGTVVKMRDWDWKIVVQAGGALLAEGTAEGPIVFTSLADDAYGGDTNGDGSATTPAARDWGLIAFEAGSYGRLVQARVTYGGYFSGFGLRGMIESRSSDVALEHVTVQASGAGGLYARDASPSISASRFADNAGYAVELDGLAAGTAARLTDTEFTTAAAGQRAGRLRVGDHPGQIDLRGTRASGSGWNGLVLEGEVVRDLDRDTTGGMPLIVTGRVTVASGATLTLHPGTVVKAWDWDWKFLVHGALMAAGTAEAPIVFTSLRDDLFGGDTNGDGDASVPAARDWGLIGFAAGSRGRLTHAAVRYGGYFSGFGLRGMVEARGTDDVQLESVVLTDSGADALYAESASVHLRGTVAGNVYGVRNGTPAKGVVDARHVWWGDASGPLHRLTNPSGTANEVSDGVRFFPWAIDADGREVTQVLLSGPTRVSPGDTVDYALSYFAGEPIADAVLKMSLPAGANYVDSDHDGVFWAQNGEVFWRLGAVPARTEGTVSVRVRFQWGLAASLRGTARVLLDGSNVDNGELDFDTAPYYAYARPEPAAAQPLSPAEIEPLIRARADVARLVDDAVGAGFKLVGGARWRRDGVLERTEALLIAASGTSAVSWDEMGVFATRLHPNGAVFADGSGSLAIDGGTGAITYGGDWQNEAARVAVAEAAIGKGACLNNCVMRGGLSAIATGALGGQSAVSPVRETQRLLGARLWPVLTSKACQTVCARFNECGPCLLALLDEERGLPEIESLLFGCNRECEDDAQRATSRCDYVADAPPPHEPPRPILICRSGEGGFGVGVDVYRCDQPTGAWRREDGPAWDCGCGPQETTASVSCDQAGVVARCFDIPADAGRVRRSCGAPRAPRVTRVGYERQCRPENLAGYWGTPLSPSPRQPGAAVARACASLIAGAPGQGACTEGETTVRVARDPNEKAGPSGDLVPGQTVTYTISYENEGAGRAHGVYVLDELDTGFDEATLDLGIAGEYIAAGRAILWDVGELAPKGELGSKGSVSFSIRVRDGLAAGTVVRNQAVVYFPSVPEETATNAVVGVVQTVAAEPQRVETGYGAPVAVTLVGRAASGAAVGFRIVTPPANGSLSGDPPLLTYTPAAGFTGLDRLTFAVSEAAEESRPAEVSILVTPSPDDAEAPEVVWVSPAIDARLTEVSANAVFSDAAGPLFAPAVSIGFSEAMDPATATAANLVVTDGGGRTVPASVTYDGTRQAIVLTPRQAWRAGSYAVALAAQVRDASGNPLAAPYSWSFEVAAACAGDCSGDRQVSIDELIRGVDIALGAAGIGQCPSFDANDSDTVTIDELVEGVNNSLAGCTGPGPTVTPEPLTTPTPRPTPTGLP